MNKKVIVLVTVKRCAYNVYARRRNCSNLYVGYYDICCLNLRE